MFLFIVKEPDMKKLHRASIKNLDRESEKVFEKQSVIDRIKILTIRSY